MSLVATALLPHTPLLQSSIGQKHASQLRRTSDAVHRIAGELYALQPHVLVILTPHGHRLDAAFACSVGETLTCSLREFGDFGTSLEVRGSPRTAYHLKRLAEQHHFPIKLSTDTIVDYGTALALLPLAELLKTARVFSITPSQLPLATHRDVGAVIRNTLMTRSDRVAVIASVELSHHANAASLHGGRKEGQAYDTAVVSAIRHGDLSPLLTLDPHTVARADTCSHAVLAMTAGVLGPRHIRPDILTYEAPFGVGECTAYFPSL